MRGKILSWTRIERPPAGFPPGRVVLLVEAEGLRVYARWQGAGDPEVGQGAHLTQNEQGWIAR